MNHPQPLTTHPMKASPADTLFGKPSKREKKRGKKREIKELRKILREIKAEERSPMAASVADMLVILADVRTNIDSLITHLAGVR
jgi:hypothetical protein